MNNLTNIYDLFIVIGSVVSGAFIATVITAYMVYDPESNNATVNKISKKQPTNNNNNNTESPFNKYLKKIYIDFDNLEIVKNNNTLDSKYTIVDKLPVGVIHITYENEVFYYYANNNSIPFKWLEIAAKVYCINNNCKHIFKTYQVLQK